MEIKEIIQLMKAVSENELTGFELEQGDMRVSMKKEKKQAAGNFGSQQSGVDPQLLAAQAAISGAGAGFAAQAAISGAGAGFAAQAAMSGAGAGLAAMGGLAAQAGTAGSPAAAGTAGAAGSPAILGEVASDQVVTCPLVGTFYGAPSPDAEDYVKVGDHVKKGQVLGLVEAMKLMNEIESEFDGILDAILVKDGDVVEYGQPLFRIR